ncbi:hypothetical protein AUR04nite_07890 [Glutamicibacter uratoxydans]|uniref:Gram-positive cocci surface proteins LPxTG domain-containing protein n=1 Tax=Glutamicibacter uratoxydans TaxID=43667 RepID=A0A4Y4DKV7_GLUUR|nr:hypothetical protein [Glutamicibacter uratoxydans]GED05257.1 hypothetical protein AUR04nite_07890 [Glutamicibacter uratoxydans]
MSEPSNNLGRKKRLPFAVVAVGALVFGGATSAAVIAPAIAATSSPAASETPAKVYPITDEVPVVVPYGQQNFSVNAEDTANTPGSVIFDVPEETVAKYKLKDGDVLGVAFSNRYNAGTTAEATYAKGQISLVLPEGMTYANFLTDNQWMFSFWILDDPSDPQNSTGTDIGTFINFGEDAARLKANATSGEIGADMIESGFTNMKITLPDGYHPIDKIVLEYYSEEYADENPVGSPFVELQITDYSISGNTLTLKHPAFPELTVGDNYLIHLFDYSDDAEPVLKDRGSIFFGVYDAEKPTQTPTASPTATETASPTATATETASPTATETASPTATATETASPTATETASPTATESASPTASETESATPTATETESASPTATESASPPETESASPTSSTDESEDPSVEPSESDSQLPTESSDVEPSADESQTPTQPHSSATTQQSQKPEDKLADTGASNALMLAGLVGVAFIAGGILLRLRRGKHS